MNYKKFLNRLIRYLINDFREGLIILYKVIKPTSFIFFRYVILIGAFSVISLLVINYIIIPYYTYSEDIYLPNVIGLSESEAKEILSDFDIEITLIDYNEDFNVFDVSDMYPRPNHKVKKGSSVKLRVINNPKLFELEDYTNISLRSFSLKLSDYNIDIDDTIYQYDYIIPDGYIIKTKPSSGELIENSDTLIVVVSKGKPPDYYVVPDLLNIVTLESVKRKLDQNGLVLGRISYKYVDSCDCPEDLLEGTVVDQSPDYNIRLSIVKPVDITIIKYNEE